MSTLLVSYEEKVVVSQLVFLFDSSSSDMRIVHVLVSYEDEKLMSQRLSHDESLGKVS